MERKEGGREGGREGRKEGRKAAIATWHSFWFCSEAGTFNCCWPKPKAKAIAIMKLANMKGFVNLSQSVERMGLTKHIPCITPCGEFYHLGIGRYLLGLAG